MKKYWTHGTSLFCSLFFSEIHRNQNLHPFWIYFSFCLSSSFIYYPIAPQENASRLRPIFLANHFFFKLKLQYVGKLSFFFLSFQLENQSIPHARFLIFYFRMCFSLIFLGLYYLLFSIYSPSKDMFYLTPDNQRCYR